jgi:tetratricopeptide (TPR) repeat protein
MTSSLPSTIQCSACGKANEVDSRFCRYCGASLAVERAEAAASADGASADGVSDLHADSTSPLRIEAHAPLVSHLSMPPAPQVDPSNGIDDEALSSPAEIDARRARQLLDRSLYLSERGDAAGAILACRQAVALAPNSPSGYSMLGLLLERTGNLARSLAAYEKAVELAPERTMERESINRLRERLDAQKGNVLFHFDDADLFGADGMPHPPVAHEDAAQYPAQTPRAEEEHHLNISAAAPGLPADFGVEPVEAEPEVVAPPKAKVSAAGARPTLAQSIAAQLPAIISSRATAPVIAERRMGDRRVTNVPVMTERRLGTERRDAAPANTVYGQSARRGQVAPIFMADAEPQGRVWDKLWQRPSYYGRSLPLAGATVLCLGFLLWARGWAVARAANNDLVAAVPTNVDPLPTDQAGTPNPAPAAGIGNASSPPPFGSTSQAGGFAITNRPADAPALAAPSGPATSAPSGAPRVAAAPGAGGPRSTGQQRRTPPQFPQVLPPAPIPSNATSSGGSSSNRPSRESGGGGVPGLAAPNIGSQAPAAPPVRVLPPGSSAPALNPAGASGRGYVRITQGRIGSSRLPQRPASQAGLDERGAAEAARGGQTEEAIQRLSNAVNADSSDAGFRYQQRAMLFLDRGDYSRAADDFQAAISAYGEQIERGEQVAAARAGQRAARNGLNLALAGKSR